MSPSPHNAPTFRQALLAWFQAGARPLPWRAARDPYRVLLSEIMLQQTRVDQALPYYERFITRWPTVQDLATAPLDDILREWEGLGYYARARNLHKAARAIVDEHNGVAPDTYEALLNLPGIGPYTAAAVASIAFGEPRAVLDGNVIRVLSRITTEPGDVRAPATRRKLGTVAEHLLDPAHPGAHNEAMMELGALVCIPGRPLCAECPVRAHCEAYRTGTQEQFPVTTPRPPVPHYDVAVGLVFDADGRVLIQRRPEEGLLGGLWEFPGGKHEPGETLEETCRRELREELGIDVFVQKPFLRLSHAYTHFKITLHAFTCHLAAGSPSGPRPIRWVTLDQLHDFAFPRANRKLIEKLTADSASPLL